MTKLRLPDVTLAIVETQCHALAREAVLDCLRHVEFGEVLVYSDDFTDLRVPGASRLRVKDWPSKLCWSKFHWHGVSDALRTSHMLMVQWDSWVIDPSMWTDEFLNNDVIGAPWWHTDGLNVGNLGFGLRSRRFIDFMRRNQERFPITSDKDDMLVCRTYRPAIETMADFRWATTKLATDFSFETIHGEGQKHFGFHGTYNWPLVLDPDVLAARISLATKNPYVAKSGFLDRMDRSAMLRQQVPERIDLTFDEAMATGHELMQANRFREAEAMFRAAVTARTNDEAAIHALAVALNEQETPEKCREASALLTHCGTMLRDEMVAVSCNMGKALGEQDRTQEAIGAFQGVLRSYPEHSLARYGRGLMLMQQRKHKEAVDDFNIVLQLDPGNDKAKFARGFANLVLGNYADGFKDYEFRRKDILEAIAQPTWAGEDLKGKTILVHGEQGHGDDIQFLRYVPKLVERGARVLAVLHPGIGSLVVGMNGVTVLTEDRSTWPHFDFWIRMMSLAAAFRSTMETVPAPLPLRLTEDEIHCFWGSMPLTDEERHHREMYGRNSSALRQSKRIKIGLCWSGSPESRYDRHRSIPLAAFEPLIRNTNAQFYSMQLGVRDTDRAAFDRLPLINLAPKLKSFRDTAIAMAGMDMVVTCDTSVAHLTGTVGVPTYVLINAFRTYWVWIQGLDWSPWYPSVKVLQQKAEGDWDEVIQRVSASIESAAVKVA